MGIITASLASEFGWQLPVKCFYCYESIEQYPYIYWIGTTADISLHYTCAVTLAAHLQSDFTRLLTKVASNAD